MNSYVVAEEESYGQWVPEVGKEYYVSGSGGTPYRKVRRTPGLDDAFLSHFAIGNVYETREEVEAHNNYLKALTKVKNRIAELNEGWVPDWSDNTDVKYSLYYSYSEYGSIRWTSSYTAKGASTPYTLNRKN